MHVTSLFVTLAAGLATFSSAMPADLGEHATIVARQSSTTTPPDGTNLPANFTIPTPGPVAPGGCFIGRVSAATNPQLLGSFVHGPQDGQVQLFHDPHLATPFMIDPDNRLRLAWFTLSVGWRRQLGHNPDGWLWMRNQGPAPQIDDRAVCDGSSGTLQCQAEPGDQMLSHGDELWVGQGPNPALQLLPVTIQTYPIPCLPLADGFHF